MTFHDSFLNKSAAISTLRHTRPDLLFLAHQTRTTHRPRFARRHPRHGVAFTSAAHALRYAIGQTDVQYIYMLPTAQCQVVDASAPHVPVSAALAHAVTMGATPHSLRRTICHRYLPCMSQPCAPWPSTPMTRPVYTCWWTTPKCPSERCMWRGGVDGTGNTDAPGRTPSPGGL